MYYQVGVAPRTYYQVSMAPCTYYQVGVAPTFQVATQISMHAHRTADTIPISGCGSTYPAQTAKHIPEWWVWLHVSFLSVYNCISTNTIKLVNL